MSSKTSMPKKNRGLGLAARPSVAPDGNPCNTAEPLSCSWLVRSKSSFPGKVLGVLLVLATLPGRGQARLSLHHLQAQRATVRTYHPPARVAHLWVDPAVFKGIAFKIETGQQDTLQLYLGERWVYEYIGPNGKSRYGAPFHFTLHADSVRRQPITLLDRPHGTYITFSLKPACRWVWIYKLPTGWFVRQSRYAVDFE